MRTFYLQKIEFSDREKSPEFSREPASTTQNQGGARDFHGRLSEQRQPFIWTENLIRQSYHRFCKSIVNF